MKVASHGSKQTKCKMRNAGTIAPTIRTHT